MGNSPRAWPLGAVMNSTPAIISGVVQFKQYVNHTVYEATYAARHGMAWIGSSDGMLHGFDIEDGSEVVALVPPGESALPTSRQPLTLSPRRAVLLGRPRLASLRLALRLGVVVEVVELIRHPALVVPVAAAAAHTP